MAKSKPVDSIKTKMYRHGFGDCFLLSFYAGTRKAFTMLIDCGIKYNTKTDVTIEKVIDDLTTELVKKPGGKPELDVLVATHEHWDHISFFHPTRFKKDLFAEFEIGQVWLAWTENPDDKEAKVINSRLREGVAALGFAAQRLAETEHSEVALQSAFVNHGDVLKARADFNDSLDDVLGFYGATSTKKISDSGIKYKENGKVSSMTEDAMENIIKLGKNGNGIRYFLPGTTVEHSLTPPGINVFVLGPPKNSQINKSNPSRGPSHETYMDIDRFGMSSFVDAAMAIGAAENAQKFDDPSRPFDDQFGIDEEDAKVQDNSFFKEKYYAPKEQYRTIENNWLDIAGQFALQLDGAINNTSLVLAIELEESGKILLFPGDAQVGSWLSWHEYQWKVQRKKGDGSRFTEKLNAQDILQNTVLYKVSHHGSHNATVKDKGLEMMTHPDLVAMIPEKEESYSGILYQPLMERLNELCKGRVIVSADSGHDPNQLKKSKPENLSHQEWKTFKSNLKIEKVFVEYTVKNT